MSLKFQAVSQGFDQLFICEECGCLESTLLGRYWSRNITGFFSPTLKGKALCTFCTPSKYESGKPSKYGKWHNQFIKKNVIDILNLYPTTIDNICNLKVLETVIQKRENELHDIL